MPHALISAASSLGMNLAPILLMMASLMIVELVLPLHPRGRMNDAHLGPNLALTFTSFAMNFAFNAVLLVVLAWLQAVHFGLLHRIPIWPQAVPVLAIVTLDLATYFAHVSMHKIPFFWRFHSVHHCDPTLDVTTTIRQHPGEGVIRYAFLTVAAILLGVAPAIFALYRLTSTLIGLTEHANIGLPLWLDTALSWFTTSPNMHKVHHARDRRYTDTNYGNLFSLWDRVFGTFTPARRGIDIHYGLDGLDAPATQTTFGLLALPIRDVVDRRATPVAQQSP